MPTARRLLATVATLSVAATMATFGGVAPAHAMDVSSFAASAWAYTNSDDKDVSFVGRTVNAPVGRQSTPDGDKFRGRFYFAFDLARFAGKLVSEATLVAPERSVTDCSAQPPLEVWRTGPIGAAPTWSNPPAELEKLGAAELIPGTGCPGYRRLDVLAAVRAAQARGDATLTLELRVAEEGEGDKQFGRTFYYRPSLSYRANTVPSIGDLRLESSKTCATQDDPTVVSGRGTTLAAKVTDLDQNEYHRVEFAAWPVDRPSERFEHGGIGYYGGEFRYDLATSGYPNGTVVAWTARGYDGYDYSEWAPQPCYFVVDSIAPAKAPKVSSTTYPESGEWSGGPGVPGTFVLDAEGDPDVVRYRIYDSIGYSWWVDAPAPGAAAEFVYTPTSSGPRSLEVVSVDRAGNSSPETTYQFLVRHSAPQVTVEMNGIHVTSRLIITPAIEGITEYRYRLDEGAEVRVPADAEGKATAELVFTEVGWPKLTVAAYTASGLAGVWSDTIRVTDAPKVDSSGYDDFYWHNAVVGKPLTWTFSPGAPGVVAYDYRLNWDQEMVRVDADANGVAVFDWTPTESGVWQMMVRGVYADGSTSEWNQGVAILIQDARPYVESYLYNPWWPEGGVGVTATFVIYEEIPGVTEFVLKLNDGAEFTVSAEGSNTVWVELAPDRVGENTLTAQARFEDGSLSPARVWTFLVAG